MHKYNRYINTILYIILSRNYIMCNLPVLYDIIFLFTALLNLYNRFVLSNTHRFIIIILINESLLACVLRLYDHC